MTDFEFAVKGDGGVVRIDLNRPDEGNALTRAMMVLLAETVRATSSRPDVKVMVLESKGPQFCRGRDGRGETSDGLTPWQVRTDLMGAVLGVYDALQQSRVPIIAKVHADAIGFGAALAGACDITLASRAANFSFPEIKHKIAPTLAMAAVHRKIPPKVLAWLIYSADRIDAEEARQIGLVSKVFSPESFESEAERHITDIAARPKLILETIKHFQASAANAPSMASDYAGALLALVRSSV